MGMCKNKFKFLIAALDSLKKIDSLIKQYATDARHQIPGCGPEMTMIQIQLSNIAGVTQYNEQVCDDDLVITRNCGKLESPGLKIIQLLDVASIALWGIWRAR